MSKLFRVCFNYPTSTAPYYVQHHTGVGRDQIILVLSLSVKLELNRQRLAILL